MRKADTHKFTGTDLDKAYDNLCHLIRHGWDFPDACYKASQSNGIDYATLSAFYDEMNATI